MQGNGSRREGFAHQRLFVLPRPAIRRARREPILSDLLPTDVGFFPRAARHRMERPEGSEQTIVIYCRDGQGEVHLHGERFAVGRGDVAVIRAGLPHAYGADARDPWTISWVHATGARVPALLGLWPRGPVFPVDPDPRIALLFDEVYERLAEGEPSPQLFEASLALYHLFGVVAHAARVARRRPMSAFARIERAQAFLRARLADRISVEALARDAGMSPSHFAACFKKHTGTSVMRWFLRVRMRRAAELLDSSTRAIQEIASDLGYDDPLYFSRQFRRVHGISPTRYRTTPKG